MAMYEGIALIQEKQAVVLDIGTDYTKFGFTGEGAPRCIVPSQFWCPVLRRQKRVHEYENAEELYDNLVNMLHMLYFRHVLVNPKERRVVVVESLLTPTLFRETLAKVLYTHYEVSGVVWADSARLCVMPLGVRTALVIDIGAKEAEVTAVVEGCPIVHAVQNQPLGSHAVYTELARLLDEDNGEPLNLPSQVIEDITIRTCLVPSRTRALQWQSDSPPSAAKPVKYNLAGRGAITVSGKARELSAEPLFYRDQDADSLPDMALKCVTMCPIDARRALCENILVVGGTASLPGLKARLAHELRYLATEPPYNSRLGSMTFKFHSAPCHDNSVAWAGAALLGAGGGAGGGDALAARALPREQFVRERRLRDWVCLIDNTPKHLKNESQDM